MVLTGLGVSLVSFPALPPWAGRWDRMAPRAGLDPRPLHQPAPFARSSLSVPGDKSVFSPSTWMPAPSAWPGKLQPDSEWGFCPGSQEGRATPLPQPAQRREPQGGGGGLHSLEEPGFQTKLALGQTGGLGLRTLKMTLQGGRGGGGGGGAGFGLTTNARPRSFQAGPSVHLNLKLTNSPGTVVGGLLEAPGSQGHTAHSQQK